MSETEIAYIAGLLDGEGCIGVWKTNISPTGKRYLKLTVRIANTDKDAIEYCKSVFGLGFVTRTQRGTWKALYEWHTTSNKAVTVLKTLLPYLRIKKRQAEDAIRFQETRRSK